MKIKKEYIGTKCWSKLLSKWLIIDESKGDYYMQAGIFYIYETTAPKLIKLKCLLPFIKLCAD